jgi:hypothetical protein
VSGLYEPSLVVITILIMALAVYAVPFPGNLLLFGAAAVGVVIALSRIRRPTRE